MPPRKFASRKPMPGKPVLGRPGTRPQKPNPFFNPMHPNAVNKLRATVLRLIEKQGIRGVYKWMEKMKPVDHRLKGFVLTSMTVLEKDVVKELRRAGRKAFFTEPGAIKTKHTGGRIRLKVLSGKAYPKTEVILKRIHGSGAFKTIQVIGNKVLNYNKRPASKKSSEVVMPDVHILAKDIVAIQKIKGLRKGALTRVLNKNNISYPRYCLELGKACNFLRILPDQIECVGVNPQTEKLVFMPLMDLI